jgi:hypothetical protein
MLEPPRCAREAEHSGDRARLAGGGLDMRRRDFRESMATADSRRSNEENSMTSEFQKTKSREFPRSVASMGVTPAG